MMKKIKSIIVFMMLIGVIVPQASFAFSIQQLDNVPVEGDLILGPGKIELFLAPGETVSRELSITNRTGRSLDINVDVEDFTGDQQSSSRLLGQEKGPYSLRDYIFPERTSFVVSHGERVMLPVKISVPKDAEPGGLYGAAIIKAQSSAVAGKDQLDSAKGQVNVISRLAELFFVRVKGATTEDGKLTSFSVDKKFHSSGPVDFDINYSNTGKVHLNPYAEIDIKNFLGRKVDTIDVSPWFVMPGFNRTRPVVWEKGLAFGYYTANIKLHRGYGDMVDESKVSFFIVPVRILLISLFVIIAISVAAWFVSSKFEFKRK